MAPVGEEALRRPVCRGTRGDECGRRAMHGLMDVTGGVIRRAAGFEVPAKSVQFVVKRHEIFLRSDRPGPPKPVSP